MSSSGRSCAVCTETSRGVRRHYGQDLCDGCSAFIKRIVEGHVTVPPCKKEGHCSLVRTSRKSCRKCRFLKCLDVGVEIEKVEHFSVLSAVEKTALKNGLQTDRNSPDTAPSSIKQEPSCNTANMSNIASDFPIGLTPTPPRYLPQSTEYLHLPVGQFKIYTHRRFANQLQNAWNPEIPAFTRHAPPISPNVSPYSNPTASDPRFLMSPFHNQGMNLNLNLNIYNSPKQSQSNVSLYPRYVLPQFTHTSMSSCPQEISAKKHQMQDSRFGALTETSTPCPRTSLNRNRKGFLISDLLDLESNDSSVDLSASDYIERYGESAFLTPIKAYFKTIKDDSEEIIIEDIEKDVLIEEGSKFDSISDIDELVEVEDNS